MKHSIQEARMMHEESSVHGQDKYVRANGIDIHYVEAGAGEPLLLLHGGVVSTNPIWS